MNERSLSLWVASLWFGSDQQQSPVIADRVSDMWEWKINSNNPPIQQKKNYKQPTSLITCCQRRQNPVARLSNTSGLITTFCRRMNGVKQKNAVCITNIWKNCLRSVAMEVVELAEILIIPVGVQVKFTRGRVAVCRLSRSLLTGVGFPHVRNRNFFNATLPLSSSMPEIPKLSCKMATLICKQITWSTDLLPSLCAQRNQRSGFFTQQLRGSRQ